MKEVRIENLRVNPAQMRTRIRVEALISLASSLGHGFDPSLHLLVRGREGDFVVVSGHRRWLAAMIANLTEGEDYKNVIDAYCRPDEDGWIELSDSLYSELADLVEEGLTVPVEEWTGGDQAEILTLIKANLGAEEPDLVGQAYAFHAALQRAVTLDELAEAVGMPISWVNAMLAVPNLPVIFQKLINDRRLGLGVAPLLAALDIKLLNGLARALEVDLKRDNAPVVYTARIKLALAHLKYTPGVPDADSVRPSEYNRARVIQALWKQAEEDSDELNTIIASRALKGWALSPSSAAEAISNMPSMGEYFIPPGNLHQHYNAYQMLSKEVLEQLLDVSCDTCAFNDLPEQRLVSNLDIDCRKPEFESGPCFHWAQKGKAFKMRTPWYWHQGGTTVQSLSELLSYWKGQAKHEAGVDFKPPKSQKEKAEGVKEQRAAIRAYMENHARLPFAVDHPWASACDRCGFHLDKSPVKSAPDAPHCHWSRGRHRLSFDAFLLEDDLIYAIPACRQFGPAGPWSDIIPESAAPTAFERELCLKAIEELSKAANRQIHSADSRGVLQFLTGRPLKASTNHKRTFKACLKKEQKALSDDQLWTLFQWVMLDWMRMNSHMTKIYVPLYDGGHREGTLMMFSGVLALLKAKDSPAEEE